MGGARSSIPVPCGSDDAAHFDAVETVDRFDIAGLAKLTHAEVPAFYSVDAALEAGRWCPSNTETIDIARSRGKTWSRNPCRRVAWHCLSTPQKAGRDLSRRPRQQVFPLLPDNQQQPAQPHRDDDQNGDRMTGAYRLRQRLAAGVTPRAAKSFGIPARNWSAGLVESLRYAGVPSGRPSFAMEASIVHSIP